MPDVQQFIIAPDKRAQGTAADLARFVAAAKAHPEVLVHKEEAGFAKISGSAEVVDGLMGQHGANLIMAVDAMLQMPTPPGPVLRHETVSGGGDVRGPDPNSDQEEDNIL